MSTPSMAAIAAPSMVAIDRARRLNRTREARQRAARLIVARYQPWRVPTPLLLLDLLIKALDLSVIGLSSE
jgi:hypothetical protein